MKFDINKIKSVWNKLDDKAKGKYVKYLIIFVFFVIVISSYVYRHAPAKKTHSEKKPETHVVQTNKELLKKNAEYEKEAELSNLTGLVDKYEKELGEKQSRIERLEKVIEDKQAKASHKNTPSVPDGDGLPKEALPVRPTPKTGQKVAAGSGPPDPDKSNRNAGPIYTVTGGIRIYNNPDAGAEKKKEDDKKKVREIFLPPSFMEATLLTGLDAPTSYEGKADSLPAFFRVAAPAILPNDVKMNIKGCFVIGSCKGNLSSERADCRLVNLSCLANDGKAVISQKVHGYVSDGDGKVGLSGTIVARLDKLLALSAFYGILGGAGNTVRSTSVPISQTSTGFLQLPSTSSVLSAGVGGGLAAASDEMQKFVVMLLKSTTPVIEVMGDRRVTLEITEPVKLEILYQCERIDFFGDQICEEYALN